MPLETSMVVVTFRNTPDACAMEAAAKEHGLPGKLIPIPSAISAGCGLAWAASPDDRGRLLGEIERLGIAYESVHDLD